jgi:predicted ATPase with chaperone activity
MPAGPAELDAGLEGLLEQLASLAEESGPHVPTGAAGAMYPRSAATCPAGDHEYMVPAPAELPRRALARDDELPTQTASAAVLPATEAFFPAAPRSLADTRVAETEIADIILRLLCTAGALAGVEISEHVGLPFPATEKLLRAMKMERLLVFKSAATLSDYVYEITEGGLQRARQSAARCSYCGVVPVSLDDYVAGVAAQSLTRVKPRIESLRRAFANLTISGEMLGRLSRAITAGRGLFLHGPPGNGKTSIAERITAAYGTSMWIPRTISVWGELIRLFDPSCHEELPLATGEGIVADEQIDHRWVRIRRPTIVVGGELTMESLEITAHKETGIGEAPLQMKSNGGTLVIDDFGRQRVAPRKLLNRWIVPLEERRDYLGLASGRKICVPFDQFIVFSTNLEPRDLVDEAFLRRIPYKIEVQDPTVEQFRKLFEQLCAKQGIAYDGAALDHLITRHYESSARSMRFCHPRDLLHQVEIFCRFRGLPPAMSVAAVDAAATDYFSVVGG